MTDNIRVVCDYNDENLPPYRTTEVAVDEVDNEADEEYPFVVKFEHRTAAILAVVFGAGVLTLLKASAKIVTKLLS